MSENLIEFLDDRDLDAIAHLLQIAGDTLPDQDHGRDLWARVLAEQAARHARTERPTQGYPTLEQVEAAGLDALTRWQRSLPSPTDENRPTLDRIMARHRELKAADPAAAVAASKRAGW